MIKKNILANYVGRFWSIFSGLLFTPLYIHFLGIEKFSIISFALVIAGLMAVLDGGLTATLSREFALKNSSNLIKVNTFSTFEILYFALSLFIFLIVFIFSDKIANSWLNLENIDSQEVSYFLKIIGIGVSLEFLCNFYSGGLMGLEKHVKVNFYKVAWGILRNGLVLIPISYFASLELFFVWQTVSTFIYTILLRNALICDLDSKIPVFRIPIIDKEILNRTWKFALGIFFISLVASINTQMDKLAISKLLPISILGYYILAVSLSQSLVTLITPISTAMLPRFTSLFSEGKIDEAFSLYSRLSLLISIIVLSIGCNIIVFAEQLIWIWTGDFELAENAYIFVPFLTIGSIMLAFQILPYSVSIANGYTKINNFLGLISLFITLPGYWIMTKYYGGVGAAITWGVTQLLITPFYIYFINNRFLPNIINFNQLLRNFIIPLLVALISAVLFAQLNYSNDNRILQFLMIGFSTISSIIICGLFLLPKNFIKKLLGKLKFLAIKILK